MLRITESSDDAPAETITQARQPRQSKEFNTDCLHASCFSFTDANVIFLLDVDDSTSRLFGSHTAQLLQRIAQSSRVRTDGKNHTPQRSFEKELQPDLLLAHENSRAAPISDDEHSDDECGRVPSGEAVQHSE